MNFRWHKKLIFNYNMIPSIEISDVKRLIVDEGQILRYIVTSNKKIMLGGIKSNKWIKTDSQRIIELIVGNNTNVEILDSWDIWFEKGYLRIAYIINTILLSFSSLAIIIAICRGLKWTTSLVILIFLLPQMFLYQKQMKQKIKKN